jgi:hypothetical protein
MASLRGLVKAGLMEIGPRLMRRHEPILDPIEEVQALKKVLSSAPGVSCIKSIERHGKGGYVAAIELSAQSLEAFLAHLEANGWMDVL